MKIPAFNKYIRLPPGEKALLIRTLILMGLVRLELWLFSLQTVRKNMVTFPGRRKEPGNRTYPVDRITWAVQVAAVIVPRSTCLVQALATQALLAAGGQASSLCIGVAKDDPSSFEAHAWVEIDGRAVIGAAESDRFTRLITLQSGPE